MTKKPLNPNAQKWVDALRSGKYTQTTKGLNDRRGHCCLGVLCEVAIENGVPIEKVVSGEKAWTTYDGENGCAPTRAMEFARLRTRMGSCGVNGGTWLTTANDEGKTFL